MIDSVRLYQVFPFIYKSIFNWILSWIHAIWHHWRTSVSVWRYLYSFEGRAKNTFVWNIDGDGIHYYWSRKVGLCFAQAIDCGNAIPAACRTLHFNETFILNCAGIYINLSFAFDSSKMCNIPCGKSPHFSSIEDVMTPIRGVDTSTIFRWLVCFRNFNLNHSHIHWFPISETDNI